MPNLRGSDGQAFVEFVLITPVLFITLAAMYAFGHVLLFWIFMNDIAGDTARLAAVDRNPTPALSLQEHALGEGLKIMRTGMNVCIDTYGAAPQVGGAVRVRMQRDVHVLPMLGVDIPLRVSATARIERFANGIGPPLYTPKANIGTCA